MNFFTADDHFSHINIIRYCDRPFKNANEMDEELISRWNSKVNKEDTVYNLGDMFFKMSLSHARYIRSRLNGHIHFIRGNHDKIADQVKDCFDSYYYYKEVNIMGQDITLCHYPMRTWNRSHRGSWMLYGHCHGSLPDDPNLLSFDIGVDCHDYYPISFDEVAAIMEAKRLAGAGPTTNAGGHKGIE